jgi:tetratricopeptide (TPR) repeat protein
VSKRMRKQRRRAGDGRGAPSPARSAELGQAEALARQQRWAEARAVLEALDRRSPKQAGVLAELANVCLELRDIGGYQHALERLVALEPADPEAMLGLAGAYLTNMHPVLALRTFRRFLERWPEHARAEEVRATVADLEASLDDLLADANLAGDDAEELAALHERTRSLLEGGRLAEGRAAAERLLARRPDYVPALNNLSQIQAIEGHFEQAIATAGRVLALDPSNVHALSNLTRYCCLSGRVDEAASWAERLKAAAWHASDASDVWVKTMEALSYLGDDRGVWEAFGAAQRRRHLELPTDVPFLYHLAAVAALRLGRPDQARHHWRRALEIAPGYDLALDNLEDLGKPVEERHGPWPFPFANWLPAGTLRALAARVPSATEPLDDETVGRATRRFLRQQPTLERLVPLLLDHGDPEGREFALRLALVARTPALLAALRDFALGQRGPDELRLEAARAATEAGHLPAGLVRLWLRGAWREVVLMSFELHDEPERRHGARVEQWLAEATEALRERDPDRAEWLLGQALAVEPDAPDALNNLAAAYELQGRSAEAEALAQWVFARHPDYLFARVARAKLCARRGQLEEARALLQPLLSRSRFHFSEFAALSDAEIELQLAEGNKEAARSWLRIWEEADPDHPAIGAWRRRLEPGRRLPRPWLLGRRGAHR